MKLFRSDIYENLMMAIATLRANKLRSFLTVFGVVIGIITVMLIASIISGIDVSVKREVESFGTRSIYISKFNPGERPPMNAAKLAALTASKSLIQQSADELIKRWPSDVITNADAAEVLSEGQSSSLFFVHLSQCAPRPIFFLRLREQPWGNLNLSPKPVPRSSL